MRPLTRKTTVWRNIGIVNARMIVIMSPNGEGLRRACAHSFTADISALCCSTNRGANMLGMNLEDNIQGFGGNRLLHHLHKLTTLNAAQPRFHLSAEK